MPDHAHLLIDIRNNQLSTVMRRLKSSSALKLNHSIGRQGRFWDVGFHDHGLRKEEDIKGVARYIVGNPLRAGLVKHVGGYPFWNAKWL